MSGTRQSLVALYALLADNSAGEISAQDVRDFARSVYGAGLEPSSVTVTNTDVTGVVGNLYVCTIAGLTANRTLTLPSATVGERLGVYIADGDDAFALIIAGAASQTINGGPAATEWSRLFIQGECVIFTCVGTNSWIVEHDRRIPQVGNMRLSTQCDGESPNTFTRCTLASTPGAWTADVNVGNICSTSGDSIIVRRTGRYNLSYVCLIKDAPADQALHGGALFHNGTANILHAATMYASGAAQQNSAGPILGYALNAGESVVFQYRTAAGSLGCSASALPRIITGFSVVEVL